MSVNHQARMRSSAPVGVALGWRNRAPQWSALTFGLLALGLLIAQHFAPDAFRQARLRAAGGIYALADTLTAPLEAVDRMQQRLRDWNDAVEENRRLHLEIDHLRLQQAPLNVLRAENEQLRALAPIASTLPRYFLAARVVGLSGGPQQQSLWINAGSEQGITADMAVMAPAGLIGRVLEVGPTLSRVLLMTDGLSRLPVRTANTRLQAIAAGDHGAMPALRYLPPHTAPEPGETVLTAGDAHLLPVDLPVGTVAADAADPTVWRVRPLADLGRLDWVSVIDFDWRRK